VTARRLVVSIIGATGLVGSEIARLLHLRGFPMSELRLFGSGRHGELQVALAGRRCRVSPFGLASISGCDICFLAAGRDFSLRHARRIASLGSVVIDNSSAFRMKPDVPLAVPEVNRADMLGHRGIIANPNCSTIQMVVALAPLDRAWRLRRVVVSTYQSVSGAGMDAVGELALQTAGVLEGECPQPRVFPHPIAFNLIPQIGEIDSGGWAIEERKLMDETRRILGKPELDVAATAVRVPVFRGHSESVYAEFEEAVEVGRAADILGAAPGVAVGDPSTGRGYPVPVRCAGREMTFVGRLRQAPGNRHGLLMWIVSDNLLKGAALNAVQIAEALAI
jgi:aspartate-semialdehyde dehydrogenase